MKLQTRSRTSSIRSVPNRSVVPTIWRSICVTLSTTVALFILIVDVSAQQAKEAPQAPNNICSTVEAVAQANALPLSFFVALIWQESRFRADEVGPITSSGQRAEGIAQFMPYTAAERGLINPFDPKEALPYSAAFLAELRKQFGNLGLAAAAYNAGPKRVQEFIAGGRDLPKETRHYVLAITGHSAEEWATHNELPLELDSNENPVTCDQLMALLKQRENRESLSSEIKAPSWCRGLSRPNPSICGSVHARPTPFAEFSRRRPVLARSRK